MANTLIHKNPLVSVIITTRNSAPTLNQLLKNIKNQSYKNIEIIVVDNNSRDKTKEIARKYTKRLYDKPPERSAQRNYGAAKARGDFLLFLDADMVLTKNVVSECVRMGDDRNVGGIIIPEKSFGRGFWAKAKALEREINAGEAHFEASRFFPKKVFQEAGGYDETLTGPEDWDLHQRVSKKYKITRTKSFIKHNEGQHTLIGLAKKKYYYGLSAYKYITKQKLPTIGPTTVYFLRTAFYRKWRRLLSDPVLALGMFVMLFAETVGGGVGYLVGRLKS